MLEKATRNTLCKRL